MDSGTRLTQEDTVTSTAAVDQDKAQAFGARMLAMVSDTTLAFMVNVGHEVGLFEAMAGLPPATSDAIAETTGLNERYVREWLATMAAARVVDYDHTAGTFQLPAEHAMSLTSAAGPANMALWAWGFIGCAEALDLLPDCFRNGGGVPYSRFTKFPKVMAAISGANYDTTLLSSTLPLVPGLVDRLEQGIDVADVGCGSGHAINIMARAFPKSRFVGYDFSEPSLAAAREEASAWGLANASFESKDAATLSGPPRFDFVTAIDAIHDQAHPRNVLKGIAEMLRPGGTFLCVDVAASSNLHENLENPMAVIMYGVSTMHCMTVSLALGGEGLGAMWGEQKARELFAEAGFTSVETKRVELDMENNYYICRK
ncbi:MAG: methyltransferase domain-containing protein [Dehalococcoidia bacterium]|nr:methyltransferase domain-containing protein [Dehalococcoidia bacterium]